MNSTKSLTAKNVLPMRKVQPKRAPTVVVRAVSKGSEDASEKVILSRREALLAAAAVPGEEETINVMGTMGC